MLDGVAYDFETEVTGNITLVAEWTATKNSYTATFVVDGTDYSTETKEYGLTFSEPIAPTKSATAEYTYTFNGWLLDGEAYDFDTLVTGNITLVADWTATKNTYTVTFDSNGGTAIDSETVEYGLTFSEPSAPEKQATAEYTYTFNGWLLDGVAYDFATEVTGNITLVADWTATKNSYTVTFVVDGTDYSSETVQYGLTFSEPVAPTRQATAENTYTFNGWLLDGVAYDFDTVVTGNITLIADWTATKNTYTVTFDSNGGSKVTSETVEYGAKFSAPINPTKDADEEFTYEFAGWLLNGVAYDFDTVVTKNITLVASWTEIPVAATIYTVTFDSNGGTTVSNKYVEEGFAVDRPADPTREATVEYTYEFAGWLLNGMPYNFDSAVTDNITLIAKWTSVKNTYTVTFDSNGGTAIDGETKPYGMVFTKPNDPTKEATAEYTYTFNGWLLDGEAYDFDTLVTEDITLIASWTATKNTYTVTFVVDGQTASTETKEYGLTFAEPTAPTKDATAEYTYTFNGWLLDGEAYDFDTLVTENITLVADWTATKNSYTVTFVVDGTDYLTETKEYGLTFSEPVAPIKEATAEFTYTFNGWLLDGVAYDFSNEVTGNITLIADWTATKNTYTVTFDSDGGTAVASETKEYGETFTKPSDPTKSATAEYTYVFVGWTLDGEDYDFNTEITRSISLVAKWDAVKRSYTVTYDSNGGTTVESETKEYGSTFTVPTDPVKQSTEEYVYTFMGWTLNGADYDFNTMVTGNIVLVAKWAETLIPPSVYIVTFDSNGGTTVESVFVVEDELVAKPSDPTKKATVEYTYTFAGWMLNGVEYDFNTPITNDIALVAKWNEIKNTYTVTFDSNGGTTINSQTVEYGLTFSEPVAPTKEATAEYTYTFNGWLLDGVAYDFDTVVTGNITLVANWTETKNSYTATFVVDGTDYSSETVEYGLTYAEPTAPTKEATAEYTYTFNGWLLDGVAYDFATEVTGNITLVADWTATKNSYTVTFVVEGADYSTETKEYGLTFAEPVAPTKEATAEYTYTFNGWLLDGVAYDFSNEVTGNITLIADWTATKNTYTVTFDSNGGSAVAPETKEYGSKFTLPANPVKSADGEYMYAFAGWFLNDVEYNFDTLVTGNITLVAKWDQTVIPPSTFVVTFNSNGGTDIESVFVTEGSLVQKPNDPTKSATVEFTFSFDCWTLNGETFDFNKPVTENIELIAKWTETKNSYTVTFNSNGGTAVVSQTKEYGLTFSEPVAPTKSATAEYTYAFNGWLLNGVDYDFDTLVTENITLVADWTATKNSYTVTFVVDGQTASTETKEYGLTFAEPTAPTKEATAEYTYTFNGWLLNGEAYNFDTLVTENITLVADWTASKNSYTVTFVVDGQTVSTETKEYGLTFTEPTAPTKEGTTEYTYTFNGWLLDGKAYDFDTVVTGNITLVASFTAIPVEIYITKLQLNASSVELEIGGTYQLVATITPVNATQGVIWTSNNESVAIVDTNGNVTAIGEGETAIFVQTVDGSIKVGCLITVTNPNAPTDPDVPDQPEGPKGGCGIAIGSALIPSMIALVGAGLVVAKKRKQK